MEDHRRTQREMERVNKQLMFNRTYLFSHHYYGDYCKSIDTNTNQLSITKNTIYILILQYHCYRFLNHLKSKICKTINWNTRLYLHAEKGHALTKCNSMTSHAIETIICALLPMLPLFRRLRSEAAISVGCWTAAIFG